MPRTHCNGILCYAFRLRACAHNMTYGSEIEAGLGPAIAISPKRNRPQAVFRSARRSIITCARSMFVAVQTTHERCGTCSCTLMQCKHSCIQSVNALMSPRVDDNDALHCCLVRAKNVQSNVHYGTCVQCEPPIQSAGQTRLYTI